jgi:hypothetical protein
MRLHASPLSQVVPPQRATRDCWAGMSPGRAMKRWLPAHAAVAVAVITSALLSGCSSDHMSGPRLARPTLELATLSLTAGYSGELAVDSHGASDCALLFAGPRGLSSGPFGISLPRPHVDWSWRVPPGATPGTWTARVACTRGSRQSPALAQQLVIRPQVRAASHARAGGSAVAFMALVQPSTGIVAPGSLRVSTAATSPAGQAGPTGGRVLQ